MDMWLMLPEIEPPTVIELVARLPGLPPTVPEADIEPPLAELRDTTVIAGPVRHVASVPPPW